MNILVSDESRETHSHPISIADMARRYVAEAICKGTFKPGSQVKEEFVAGKLKISRPPVREAFKVLESEGLLQRKPRCGVFVAHITESDVAEIYTLKAELYSFSIRLCFAKLTSEQISQMSRIVEAMEEVVRQEPPLLSTYEELNVSFHDIHVDTAGHKRLKQILNTLHNQVRYFSRQNLMQQAHLRISCQYHRQIMEAFAAGDQEAAITLSRDHVFAGLNRFRDDAGTVIS